jgi:O-antigen/teichoic acid export membrane protein
MRAMSTRHIASSTLWQIASQATMAALSILTVKFVAVGLSKELAGHYNSAYGFLQLFGILADFGLYAVAVREVSRAKDKGEVLGAIMILRIITLVLSLVSALAIVWIVPTWKGTPLPLGVTIASLVPFFTLLAGVVRTVFQVQYKMHYVFIAEVSQRILAVLLIGSFIVMGVRGSTDLQVYHMFLFFGGVGAFLLFLLSHVFAARLIRVKLQWNSELISRLARQAAPYGIAFLCVAFYRQFDVTLIALLRPDFEIQNAYYGFVLRMADMGFLIPTFLLNSTLPILSERDANKKDVQPLLAKTLLILLLLGSISFLFSILWARPLIQLLTTEAYLSTAARAGSDTALTLLALPIFLNGIIQFGFYVLLARHHWKKLTMVLGAGALLSLVLNVYLIPQYGFVGACITSIIVHILLASALFIEARRTFSFRFPVHYFARWIIFSAFIFLGLWLLKPLLTSELPTVIGLAVMAPYIGVAAILTGLHKELWGEKMA